jgi:hypothetical protein
LGVVGNNVQRKIRAVNIIREEIVEEVTATRNGSEEHLVFSRDASDRLGGFFISVGAFQHVRAQVARPTARDEGWPLQAMRRMVRVIELILLSLFSEHLASPRCDKAALQNEY